MRVILKERVFRLFLNRIDEWISFKDIFIETGLKKPYISRILKSLLLEGLLIRDGDRFHVVDYKGIFRKWIEIRDKIDLLKYFYVYPQVYKINRILEDNGVEYAVTGLFAENIIHGYTPISGVEIYLDSSIFLDIVEMLGEKGLLKSFGKGNLILIPYDKHVFYGKFFLRGWWIVSFPQLALDLVLSKKYGDIGYKLLEEWLEKHA